MNAKHDMKKAVSAVILTVFLLALLCVSYADATILPHGCTWGMTIQEVQAV